jgi:hypothetical protein
VRAWEKQWNAAVAKVDWQFTTADARVKLKRCPGEAQVALSNK